MREKPISIKSVDGDTLIDEPTVSPEVYFSSFAINLLALALPLSIMQLYDRIHSETFPRDIFVSVFGPRVSVGRRIRPENHEISFVVLERDAFRPKCRA